MMIQETGEHQRRPRPFLKWAGGKGRLLSQIAPFFPPDCRTYFEPFCGGGAVFFARQPMRAVLSDINPELINVYQCVRGDVEGVIDLLRGHASQHSAEHFYAMRAQQPESLAALERAARVIYLNRTCFNGLYRENAHGQFNVPLGRYVNPTICDAPTLRAASWALRPADIHIAAFDQVLDHAQPGDVVYFDPPYHPLSVTSSFTSYSRFAFGAAEQRHLHAIFAELARRDVRALLSNSDCPFTRDLYQDFRIATITAGRSINTRADRRGPITEILVLNWS